MRSISSFPARVPAGFRGVWLAPLFVLVASIPLGACVAPHVAVTPEYAGTKVDGSLGIANGSVSSRASLDSLGLDGREGDFAGRVDVSWLTPHLTVGYLKSSFSGSGVTDAQLSHGGTTIPVSANVDSDLDIAVGTAVVTFDFAPTDMLELGIGLGLESLELDGRVRNTGNGDTVDTNETIPIPVISARAGVKFWRIDASVLASYSNVKVDNDDLTFYDVDLQARLGLSSWSAFTLGYRRVHADVQYNESGGSVDANLDFQGPYLGFTFGF